MCGVEMTGDLLRLDVDGMSCAACVASVEKIVGSVDSVKAVAVNLALNSASIQLNKSPTVEMVDGIIEVVNQGGFSATRQSESEPLRERMAQQVTNEGRKAGLAL